MSIVTAVLNGRSFLPDLLASVREQDYPAIEHVVVDGGSTDGTQELLAATPGLRWTSGPDGGMYDAINRGLGMATGDVLAYQNADDRYVPGAVAEAVRHLHAEPKADAVYGEFRYVDASGRVLRTSRGQPFDRRRLRRYNCVPPHALFVKAEVVKTRGHWLDPELQFAGDWDWVLGMAEAGVRFRHVPEVWAEFRLHASAKTARVPLGERIAEWRRICRRHRVSLGLLLWHELVSAPVRRRLGRAT